MAKPIDREKKKGAADSTKPAQPYSPQRDGQGGGDTIPTGSSPEKEVPKQ